MSDVKNKTCGHEGCTRNPVYGTERGKPTRCAKHATAGMSDVKNKTCGHEGCAKQPSYGVERGKPTRCAAHATEGMVNVISSRCDHQGCTKQPSYGTEREKPTRCAEHATTGMVNVRHKRCDHDGCDRRPSFGVERGKPTRCATHATVGMVDVINRQCGHEGCDKRPSFGILHGKPTRCAEHATAGMSDVTNRRCTGCGLFQSRDLCVYCRPHGKKRTRERAVVDFLREAFPDDPFTHDKSIGRACGGYRPDVLFARPTHDVIVEIDEDQHAAYDKACEYARMINIVQSRGRPTVFVRYNPDAKAPVGGVAKRVSKKRRHAVLSEEVRRRLAHPPSDLLELTYLFYDDTETRCTVPELPLGM